MREKLSYREAALQVYREICREEGGAPDFDAFSQADWDAYYARYVEVTATEDGAGHLGVPGLYYRL